MNWFYLDLLPKHQEPSHCYEHDEYEGFWCGPYSLEGILLMAQDHFKPQPNQVILSSTPKSSTTWLEAPSFAIITRSSCDESTNPLLTKMAHDLVPFLEFIVGSNVQTLDLDVPLVAEEIHQEMGLGPKNTSKPIVDRLSEGSPAQLASEKAERSGRVKVKYWRAPTILLYTEGSVATHIPYTSLPKSIINSCYKIVYICSDPKDVFVSQWHFAHKLSATTAKASAREDLHLEDAFEFFCGGLSPYGPYWDHLLGYWRASLESPEKILFLKCEDLKANTISHIEKLC
ncbi:flavonol sulfotransferase-like [Quercus suber]|uniref:flavonol sulfotransferase-like n=1 Tax=Quercus suber TaxID=58331 RepID=UPI0032DFAAEA